MSSPALDAFRTAIEELPPGLVSQVQVEDVLALLVLQAKVPAESLSEPFVSALAGFGARLKSVTAAPGSTLQAQIDAYLIENPPHPRLLAALRRSLGEPEGRPVTAGQPLRV